MSFRILTIGLCITFLAPWTLAAETVFEEDYILSLLHKVNDYQQDHPWTKNDRNWIRATYYTGLMNLYDATKDERLLEQALAWEKKHKFAVGSEKAGGNKLTCVQTWIELYFIKKDPAMIQPAIEWLDTDKPNSPSGQQVWYKDNGLRYADSLYVGPPALGMLYKATGDNKYLKWMTDFYWDIHDVLYDEELGLYYRDRRFSIGEPRWNAGQPIRSPNGKLVHWARGEGWVFAGIPRILKYLPEGHADRERFLEIFRRMAKTLAHEQEADGLWRPNITDRLEYQMPDSSASAFFVTAYAWGIRNGVLDKDTYLPTLMKGWLGLTRCVDEDGRMNWVQPVDGQPNPSGRTTTHEYGTGMLLSAGSEMIRLVRAGIITGKEPFEDAAASKNILPVQRLKAGPIDTENHPFAKTINELVARQERVKGFQPTGLTKKAYLDVIYAQVKAMQAYQNAEGRIIDPVDKKETYYSSPCYAHAVAALVSAGYPIDASLRESGMKALDVSLKDMAKGTVPMNHGDFYTWPAVFAYELFEGYAAPERHKQWRAWLTAVNPQKLYKAKVNPRFDYKWHDYYKVYAAKISNWNVVNAAGESARWSNGLTDDIYFEHSLALQLKNFTNYGMYIENGEPLSYDLFSRHYLAGMLHRGYRGILFEAYRDMIWRGAWMSLLMQSPFGELPTNYRSSHHGWNEAEQAVVFEIYANHYAAAGRHAEAGMFKRAARLSLQSYQEWIREDGTGFVVKNRYPIEAKHGYESYTKHTCYNMLACSMLAQAWQFADDSVEERPCPADLGGFAFYLPEFHMIFANAGGNYVQYDTRGDMRYNPTGLLRVHLLGGHPQLGPSDGCAPYHSGKGNFVATGPVYRGSDGEWHALAEHTSVPSVDFLKQNADSVSFRVAYKTLDNVSITQAITLDHEGVTVRDEISGDTEALRITWPMLVFDGQQEAQVNQNHDSIQLTLDGRSVKFSVLEPSRVKINRGGQRIKHRNGLIEVATVDMHGSKATYRISVP